MVVIYFITLFPFGYQHCRRRRRRRSNTSKGPTKKTMERSLSCVLCPFAFWSGCWCSEHGKVRFRAGSDPSRNRDRRQDRVLISTTAGMVLNGAARLGKTLGSFSEDVCNGRFGTEHFLTVGTFGAVVWRVLMMERVM
jgi:hypothetical protein